MNPSSWLLALIVKRPFRKELFPAKLDRIFSFMYQTYLPCPGVSSGTFYVIKAWTLFCCCQYNMSTAQNSGMGVEVSSSFLFWPQGLLNTLVGVFYSLFCKSTLNFCHEVCCYEAVKNESALLFFLLLRVFFDAPISSQALIESWKLSGPWVAQAQL